MKKNIDRALVVKNILKSYCIVLDQYLHSTYSRLDSLSIVSRQSVLAIIVACLTVLGSVNTWGAIAKWNYSSDGLSNTVKGQITASYAQNNGTNPVAIESNVLKLYRQSSSPYNGCSVTFTASSGYQITAIKVAFAAKRTSARGKIDNGSYEDVFSGGQDKIVTISSLTATSYSIQNQATGSNTVTIDSIMVTYSSTCDKNVTVSNGGSSTNGTITSITTSPVATCSSTAADRRVSILVTPSTGYVAPTDLSVGTTTGTVNSSKVSRTDNGNGTFTFVYGYNQNDNGTISYNAACVGKQCTVTFDKNSGTGGDNSVTATYGSAMTDITPPTREHFDFDGYYDSETNNNGTGNKYYNSDGSSAANWNKNTTAATTLYAKWTEHSVTNYRTICSTTYDITLDKNGGDADGSAKVAANGTQLTKISAPTKTGYKVDGYYAESGKTNKVAAADGTLEKGVEISSTAWTNSDGEWVKGSNATFYTKWEAISYEVRFNANDENYLGDATGSMSNQSFDYDENKALTTNAFSLAGYDFAGWALTADGDVEYDDKEAVENLSSTDDAVVDLYAIWTAKKYTLTLAATNETSSVGSQTVQATYNATMPLKTTADGTPVVVDPSRTGYTFDGWEYSGTQYYSYDAGEDEISSAHVWDVASTATLTPRWNVNSYTLTWDLDGGTVTEAGTGAAVDETGTPYSSVNYGASITAPTVTKAGYNFAGWDNTPADNMPASNTTYTATWTEKTVTGWTFTNHRGGAEITSDPIVVYQGQKVRLDIAYIPSDVLATHTVKENYSQTSTNTYIYNPTKASAYFTFTGNNPTTSTTTITLTHTEDTSDPKAFAKTVNVEVRALPTDTYLDLVHGISFSGPYGASLIDSDYGVQFTYTAPGGDVSDWSSTYANTCEQYHVHLIGWVESTWADEHLGDAEMPDTDDIISSGYYHPVGETMTVSGKTYYAVWAKVE